MRIAKRTLRISNKDFVDLLGLPEEVEVLDIVKYGGHLEIKLASAGVVEGITEIEEVDGLYRALTLKALQELKQEKTKKELEEKLKIKINTAPPDIYTKVDHPYIGTAQWDKTTGDIRMKKQDVNKEAKNEKNKSELDDSLDKALEITKRIMEALNGKR